MRIRGYFRKPNGFCEQRVSGNTFQEDVKHFTILFAFESHSHSQQMSDRGKCRTESVVMCDPWSLLNDRAVPLSILQFRPFPIKRYLYLRTRLNRRSWLWRNFQVSLAIRSSLCSHDCGVLNWVSVRETCRSKEPERGMSSLLYTFFWVIARRLNFICQRFGTHCSFFIPTRLWRWNSVPKRRHIKFRRQRITQKNSYNIQNTAKVWKQESHFLL